MQVKGSPPDSDRRGSTGQIPLTRKRSLVQIQYGPPHSNIIFTLGATVVTAFGSCHRQPALLIMTIRSQRRMLGRDTQMMGVMNLGCLPSDDSARTR
jgi:hypothetical protein